MDKGEYEELLEKAYTELPAIVKETTRFVTPTISAMIQGKLTVVQNLGEVSKLVNREPDLLAKFLLKELGTSGSIDGQHLTLKGQFRPTQIQEKFEAFLGQYVLCSECGRPDTKILKEERFTFLKCEACGSRHPISALKMPQAKEGGAKVEIGDEITVEITRTGKKGDGMARMDKYIVFVSGAREGQKVRAKIKNVQGTMLFADATEILKK